jgi:flagellar motor switch protein FliN/FliY
MADEQPPFSSQQQQEPREATTPATSAGPPAAAGGTAPEPAPEPAPAAGNPRAEAGSPADSPELAAADQAAIDELLKQANFEDPTGVADLPPAPEAAPFDLPSFQQVIAEAQVSSIDLLRDVELNVKIELGRSRMFVEDVLKLGEGSVVELDKLAGDPVDVFVNDRLVARGEVLVLNDNFCVRVNEIVAGVREEGQ